MRRAIHATDPSAARAGSEYHAIVAGMPRGLAPRPSRATNIVLIDNRDSFTASLAAACHALGATVDVIGNRVAADDALGHALRHDAVIMLSPGQGGPHEAGCCLELISLAAGRVPLIGVCLGHQAIVAHHGGSVVPAHEPCHGRSSVIDHDGQGPFAGLPSPMRVGRYHALCTPLNGIGDRLRVHAVLDGMAMAVSNREQGQYGVQFHPESILTPLGARLLGGVLDWADERRRAFAGLTAAAPAGRMAA